MKAPSAGACRSTVMAAAALVITATATTIAGTRRRRAPRPSARLDTLRASIRCRPPFGERLPNPDPLEMGRTRSGGAGSRWCPTPAYRPAARRGTPISEYPPRQGARPARRSGAGGRPADLVGESIGIVRPEHDGLGRGAYDHVVARSARVRPERPQVTIAEPAVRAE